MNDHELSERMGAALQQDEPPSGTTVVAWTVSARLLEDCVVAMREAVLQLEDDLDGTAFRDRNDNDAHDLDSLRELMRAVRGRKAAGEGG